MGIVYRTEQDEATFLPLAGRLSRYRKADPRSIIQQFANLFPIRMPDKTSWRTRRSEHFINFAASMADNISPMLARYQNRKYLQFDIALISGIGSIVDGTARRVANRHGAELHPLTRRGAITHRRRDDAAQLRLGYESRVVARQVSPVFSWRAMSGYRESGQDRFGIAWQATRGQSV